MGDLRELLDDPAVEGRPLTLVPSLTSTASQNPFSIGPERWATAEEVSQCILQKVQPTAVSEERRRAVIDYVQRLVRGSLGCEVFPYGSVPLKTYLPDGDIDLTIFGGPMMEDALANDLVSVLEEEEHNKGAEFIVTDVQLIRAEVKLVKCIVQNIIVDISFNQIGGLCTLCFLEQVDRLIVKDHLFKRSIILIKAWCYYESRILGAFHGLISTYALETLVLYIFHLFHSTLDGPLAVLYRFLEYFSKFDWENYCISLSGPVRVSSLPNIVAEAPVSDGGGLLLSSDFLRYCAVMFSVPSRGIELNSRTFSSKHLNIVDPLKENNNLGRSVSRGNFYRIRSAFAFGARKLGRILLQSEDKNAVDELRKFFSNTLVRHGSGQRPDVRDFNPLTGYNSFCSAYAVSEINSSQVEKLNSRLKSCDLTSTSGDCKVFPNGSCNIGDRDQESTMDAYRSKLPLETGWHGAGNALDCRLLGDAMELASSINQDLKFPSHLHSFAHLGTDRGAYVVDMPPHNHFTSPICNGEMKMGNSEQASCNRKHFSGLKQRANERKGLEKNLLIDKHQVSIPVVTKDAPLAPKTPASSNGLRHVKQDWPFATGGRSMQPLNSLLDLGGDFNYHFSCLQYGRWCHDYASQITFPIPASPASVYLTYSWDAVQQPLQVKRNGFLHGSANTIIPSQAFYTINPVSIPSMAFGLEDISKPRGTGTYFPNMNQPPKGYRSSAWKGRSQAPVRSPRTNGRNASLTETNTLERSCHEPPESQSTVDQSVVNQPSSPCGGGHPKQHPNKTDLVSHSEGATEFGSGEDVPARAPLERTRQQKHALTPPQHSSPASPTLGSQLSKPVFSRDRGSNV